MVKIIFPDPNARDDGVAGRQAGGQAGWIEPVCRDSGVDVEPTAGTGLVRVADWEIEQIFYLHSIANELAQKTKLW